MCANVLSVNFRDKLSDVRYHKCLEAAIRFAGQVVDLGGNLMRLTGCKWFESISTRLEHWNRQVAVDSSN